MGKSLFSFLIKLTTGGKNGDDGRQQVRLHRPHHLRRLHPVPLRLVLNLTKLFTVVSYGFFVSESLCPLRAFPALSGKHNSLVEKYLNQGQKSFITLAPGLNLINLFSSPMTWIR
jgi:hypothetical protein